MKDPPNRLKYEVSRRMWTALDWLFPPACAGCDKPGVRWCTDYVSRCDRVLQNSCALCGKSHAHGAENCLRAEWLDAVAAWGWHQDPLRKAIHQLKYKGNLVQGDALAVYLVDLVQQDGIDVNLVLPVPLGRKRQRERGYNQAALLARPIAAAMGLPYRPGALSRIRETASQVGMNLASHRKNVAGAFKVKGRHLTGQRVLLVDDVLTTGSMLDAAAGALKAAVSDWWPRGQAN